MYFLDASAVVKAYINERGSETIQQGLEQLHGSFVVSELVAVETMACFARLRRKREISARTYRTARGDFLSDLATEYFLLPLASEVFDSALSLLHVLKERGIGAADALHLCTAEWLQSITPGEPVRFICSDDKLRRAAATRGFTVFDPETDPLTLLDTSAISRS